MDEEDYIATAELYCQLFLASKYNKPNHDESEVSFFQHHA